MRLAVINRTGGGASGGYRRYVSAILPRIAADPCVEAMLCAAPQTLSPEAWLSPSPKIRFATCEAFRFLRHSPDPALKSALDRFAPDLIFVPLERYMSYCGVPVVTVLHNMAPLAGVKTGCGLMSRVKSLAQAYEAKLAVRRSSAVIAPTKFVHDFLVSELGAPPAKVPAIPFGPSPLPSERRCPEPMNGFRGAKFIFAAGSIEAYRGIEDLAGAFNSVAAKVPGLKLAIAGGERPETRPYLEGLKALARGSGAGEDIIWLGKLSDAEMAWCYDACSAFVMTSRLESFGFPALEAMQYGCQCVSTSSPCLPEIFGDSALYYSAGRPEELASRLIEALGRGDAERERFSAMGKARASGFSWDRTAAQTLEVLRRAAGL